MQIFDTFRFVKKEWLIWQYAVSINWLKNVFLLFDSKIFSVLFVVWNYVDIGLLYFLEKSLLKSFRLKIWAFWSIHIIDLIYCFILSLVKIIFFINTMRFIISWIEKIMWCVQWFQFFIFLIFVRKKIIHIDILSLQIRYLPNWILHLFRICNALITLKNFVIIFIFDA